MLCRALCASCPRGTMSFMSHPADCNALCYGRVLLAKLVRQNMEHTPLCSMSRLPAERYALPPWRCRLKEAGAVLIAKLVSGEMAYYDVWFDGFTKNPWNLLEGSSGSSAGVVAVLGWGAQPAGT